MPLALWRVLDGGWRWPLWLLVMLVLAAGLLVSTERAGWLAALVASAVVVLARVPRAWRVPSAATFVLAGAGAAALVLGPLGQLHSDPLGVRTQLWALTVPMIEARPLLGWGEDTFGLAFAPYAHGYLPGVVFDRAHSQVLDLLAAQGVAGLAANAWFWGALAWGVRSRWPREESPALTAALLAYAIWAVVNFDWVPVTGPAWLLAGVVWSVGVGYSPPSQERAGHAAPLRLTAAVIATVAAIAFGVLPIIADNAYYRGDARLAVTLDPVQARYHSALAENLEAGGDAQGAAAERRRATELGG
jgi:O-antigen ligase